MSGSGMANLSPGAGFQVSPASLSCCATCRPITGGPPQSCYAPLRCQFGSQVLRSACGDSAPGAFCRNPEISRTGDQYGDTSPAKCGSYYFVLVRDGRERSTVEETIMVTGVV